MRTARPATYCRTVARPFLRTAAGCMPQGPQASTGLSCRCVRMGSAPVVACVPRAAALRCYTPAPPPGPSRESALELVWHSMPCCYLLICELWNRNVSASDNSWEMGKKEPAQRFARQVEQLFCSDSQRFAECRNGQINVNVCPSRLALACPISRPNRLFFLFVRTIRLQRLRRNRIASHLLQRTAAMR